MAVRVLRYTPETDSSKLINEGDVSEGYGSLLRVIAGVGQQAGPWEPGARTAQSLPQGQAVG